MWLYEVSGKQVLVQWFSYRKANRERPLIGDRRPPSSLGDIQPSCWLAEYTTELIDLLNVLGLLIDLEPAQAQLVQRIRQANPKTIVVLVSSFPYAMAAVQLNAPAILHMSHSSQEQGNALADVLFGDYNPGGRLSVTWPKSLNDLPPMMEYDIRKGRTYMYSKAEPQYPFGFGLSYTTFEYSNLRTSAEAVSAGGEITVSVDVKNTGGRAGDEVPQLYISYPGSSVERPIRQLRGFQRITLGPNQTRTAKMTLKASDLAYWDAAKHAFTVEPGKIEVQIGTSSADIRLKKILSVN